ncbi:MAG: hypothetical protein QNJ97_12000 [Myxococcota bacterium]|nr:hypothetical protein [Myxococcota bacterium]
MKQVSIIGAFTLIFVGCSGAGAPKTAGVDQCREQLAQFKSAGNVCDPFAVEQLEGQINQWEQTCADIIAQQDQRDIRDLMLRSHACSDRHRQRRARRDTCTARIREMAHQDCTGKMCEWALKEITDLMVECRTYTYSDDTLAVSTRLIEHLENQIADEKVAAGFIALSDECIRVNAIFDEKSGSEKKMLLDQLLDKMKVNGQIATPLDETSIAAKERDTTIPRCRIALRHVIKGVVEQISWELEHPKIEENPVLWMTHFRTLGGISSKLDALEARALFPESTELIKKTLDEFTPEKEEMALRAEKISSEKFLQAAKQDIDRCGRLAKKRERFKAKVTSHQAKGNGKKVAAYQAKLENAIQEIDTLKAAIRDSLGQLGVPEAIKKQLLTDLKKTQCRDVAMADNPT